AGVRRQGEHGGECGDERACRASSHDPSSTQKLNLSSVQVDFNAEETRLAMVCHRCHGAGHEKIP
ncbi:hypothetical protein ACFRLW_33240, partial [Streptomyces sp. NPDC056728]